MLRTSHDNSRSPSSNCNLINRSWDSIIQIAYVRNFLFMISIAVSPSQVQSAAYTILNSQLVVPLSDWHVRYPSHDGIIMIFEVNLDRQGIWREEVDFTGLNGWTWEPIWHWHLANRDIVALRLRCKSWLSLD